MEGITWIRVSAIAALILGSLYVLAPSFLQGGSEERLASQASNVSTQGPKVTADLEVAFDVASGDGQALADALKSRLDAAGVPTRVVELDQDVVRVQLGVGGHATDATRLASIRGATALYAPESLKALPAAPTGDSTLPESTTAMLDTATDIDAAYWGPILSGMAGMRVPPEAQVLPLTVKSAEALDAGARVTFFPGEAFPEDHPLAVLAVDDRVAGVVLADGSVGPLAAGEVGADAMAAVRSGPLPGALAPVATPLAPEASPEPEAAEVATSTIPPWLQGLLPNTGINLGLDLQGGIDLTLQVELSDAILGQATRDITYLKDSAVKEGLILETVRRAHVEPVIEVTTDAELADVQSFLRKRLPDYTYVDSDGRLHRFEMTEQRQQQVQDQAVEQVLETLRKRVDATGVKEPSIVKKGGGRINVQLPGMVDVQAAVDAIGTTAVLEFRMVDEEYDDAYLEQIIQAAQVALPEEQYLDDEILNRWLWDQKKLDPERMILWEYELGEDGTERRSFSYPLVYDVILTGNDVNDAGVGWDQNQQPYVSLEFKPRGGQIFCDVTGKAVGKRFAIVLDAKVTSAPSIRERICGGAARIDMGSATDPLKESQTLALVLRTGALDAPVVVASVRQVGASLGADSIRQGSIGAVVGSIFVLLFMALWYRTAGIIADFALIVNVLLVMGALATFGATLTLPGIAGIALTVGMAVDANIIIYERIREELRLGVHPRKAVDVGFEKAVVAVLDANITTAIAGVVLFSYGSGPIKGFAVTLLIGIVTTLVTALFVTRTVMELVTRSSSARLRI